MFNYRSNPHTITGISSAELLLKRPMRTHLDLLREDFRRGKVERYQWDQKERCDQHARPGIFLERDKVYVSGVSRLAGVPKWLSGTVTACIVTLEDGRMFRRHNDHIRHRCLDVAASPEPAVVPKPRCETRREAAPELGSTSPSRLQPHLGEADDKLKPRRRLLLPLLCQARRLPAASTVIPKVPRGWRSFLEKITSSRQSHKSQRLLCLSVIKAFM